MNKRNGKPFHSPPREPERPTNEPVQNNIKPECKGCPFPRHGFICWSSDGSCMRTRYRKEAKPDEAENGS